MLSKDLWKYVMCLLPTHSIMNLRKTCTLTRDLVTNEIPFLWIYAIFKLYHISKCSGKANCPFSVHRSYGCEVDDNEKVLLDPNFEKFRQEATQTKGSFKEMWNRIVEQWKKTNSQTKCVEDCHYFHPSAWPQIRCLNKSHMIAIDTFLCETSFKISPFYDYVVLVGSKSMRTLCMRDIEDHSEKLKELIRQNESNREFLALLQRYEKIKLHQDNNDN